MKITNKAGISAIIPGGLFGIGYEIGQEQRVFNGETLCGSPYSNVVEEKTYSGTTGRKEETGNTWPVSRIIGVELKIYTAQ